MDTIGVGIIGTGFMGMCHAQAWIAANHAFEPARRARLVTVADIDGTAAEAARRRFGFERATTDWRSMLLDPAIGVISIASPNALHVEMALAAVEAGRHVWCEKPLALNAPDARRLAEAAAEYGVVTLVGYNYLRSPAIRYARRLVEQGEIGEIVSMRAIFDEDYMADPALPFSWRCRKADAGTGALGDMGSHVISLARYLAGPIASVQAAFSTVIDKRPMPRAGAGREQRSGAVEVDWSDMRDVENEDICEALVRFENGALGHIGTSRLAWGRKNGMDFELYGTKGALRFTQERFNEIKLFRPSERGDDNGFRTILTGPAHPPYGHFSPAVGHGLGFNELKTAEAAHLLGAIAGTQIAYPDFAEGLAIEEVCDAMVESANTGRWVDIA